MLKMAGYNVLTGPNGREELEVYGTMRDSICLVLLDLIMPEMTGQMCLQELLRMGPEAKVRLQAGNQRTVQPEKPAQAGLRDLWESRTILRRSCWQSGSALTVDG